MCADLVPEGCVAGGGASGAAPGKAASPGTACGPWPAVISPPGRPCPESSVAEWPGTDRTVTSACPAWAWPGTAPCQSLLIAVLRGRHQAGDRGV